MNLLFFAEKLNSLFRTQAVYAAVDDADEAVAEKEEPMAETDEPIADAKPLPDELAPETDADAADAEYISDEDIAAAVHAALSEEDEAAADAADAEDVTEAADAKPLPDELAAEIDAARHDTPPADMAASEESEPAAEVTGVEDITEPMPDEPAPAPADTTFSTETTATEEGEPATGFPDEDRITKAALKAANKKSFSLLALLAGLFDSLRNFNIPNVFPINIGKTRTPAADPGKNPDETAVPDTLAAEPQTETEDAAASEKEKKTDAKGGKKPEKKTKAKKTKVKKGKKGAPEPEPESAEGEATGEEGKAKNKKGKKAKKGKGEEDGKKGKKKEKPDPKAKKNAKAAAQAAKKAKKEEKEKNKLTKEEKLALKFEKQAKKHERKIANFEKRAAKIEAKLNKKSEKKAAIHEKKQEQKSFAKDRRKIQKERKQEIKKQKKYWLEKGVGRTSRNLSIAASFILVLAAVISGSAYAYNNDRINLPVLNSAVDAFMASPLGVLPKALDEPVHIAMDAVSAKIAGLRESVHGEPKFEEMYFFEADKEQRYIAYKEAHPEFSSDEVVWRVNSGADLLLYESPELIADFNETPIVINKFHSVPPNYTPRNMVNVSGTAMQANPDAYEAFLTMQKDAEAAGLHLTIASAFRSYEYQGVLYNPEISDTRENLVNQMARPGFCEHQSGLAFDLSNAGGHLSEFAASPEAEWVQENAEKYGFILRYPEGQEEVTGFRYEPWHIRYLGSEIVDLMQKNDIATLEEYKVKYIDHKPGDEPEKPDPNSGSNGAI
ncbi:MAG: D-alanyl-D-alanine carboxypeptidase family protein [Clostridiales Family XIII bacterium]|jgi:LAS superfamily LD-carboxypeptidase LdcB|nr:D-alanyl-D-alanine carboxypeptidase family protein [Clostridiales Family XIII bacterium]